MTEIWNRPLPKMTCLRILPFTGPPGRSLRRFGCIMKVRNHNTPPIGTTRLKWKSCKHQPAYPFFPKTWSLPRKLTRTGYLIFDIGRNSRKVAISLLWKSQRSWRETFALSLKHPWARSNNISCPRYRAGTNSPRSITTWLPHAVIASSTGTKL